MGKYTYRFQIRTKPPLKHEFGTGIVKDSKKSKTEFTRNYKDRGPITDSYT